MMAFRLTVRRPKVRHPGRRGSPEPRRAGAPARPDNQWLVRIVGVAALLGIWVADCNGQEARPIYSLLGELGDGMVRSVAESPRGHLVLYSVAGARGAIAEARLFDRETGEWRTLGGSGADYAWSHSGELLAFAASCRPGEARCIRVLPVDGGTGRPAGPMRRASRSPGRDPVFSPDDRWLAFASPSRDEAPGARVFLVPADGGEERVLLRSNGGVERLQWSSDGRWLFFLARAPCCSAATISRVSVDGGAPQPIRPAEEFLGISPDGRFLAYRPVGGGEPRDLRVAVATLDGIEVAQLRAPHALGARAWSTSGWKLLADLSRPRSTIEVLTLRGAATAQNAGELTFRSAPAWSPTGRLLAYVAEFDEQDQLTVMDASGSGPRLQVSTRTPPGRNAPLWSPDERYLAFVSPDARSLSVVELATGVESELVGAGLIESVAWRSDAGGLVFARADSGERAVWEVSLEGAVQRVLSLPSEVAPVRSVTLAGDTLLVAIADDAVWLAPLNGRTPRVALRLAAGERMGSGGRIVSVSPDGRWVAAALDGPSSDGNTRHEIRLVPLGSGSARALPTDLTDAEIVAWHPDGRHLLVGGRREPDSRAEVYLAPLDGTQWRRLTGRDASAEIRDAVLSPSGDRIAYSAAPAGPAALWEIDLARVLAGYLVPWNGGSDSSR